MITETQIRIARARLHALRGEPQLAERLLSGFAEAECPECGCRFRRLVGNKRYCTPRCQSRAGNRRHRERSRNGQAGWIAYMRAYYARRREDLKAASKRRYCEQRAERLAAARRRYRDDPEFRQRSIERARRQKSRSTTKPGDMAPLVPSR